MAEKKTTKGGKSKAKKTIEISPELYNALQELKGIFKQLSGEDIQDEEQVIGILVSGFIESLQASETGPQKK